MTANSPISSRKWTHPSVIAFAGTRDPVTAIITKARSVVLKATDIGWSGPPFDPEALAECLGIPVVPHEDIDDARTVPVGATGIRIEFNPNRPRARKRYSLAHELAHTLFPDCAQRVRHRLRKEAIEGDEWQLEMLCNVAAAELLMPVGSFPQLKEEALTIDNLMQLRQNYDVSSEAILIRAVRLTDHPCCMFAVSREEPGEGEGVYRVDYAIPSRGWPNSPLQDQVLPKDSVVGECTAVGFTAKRDEEWLHVSGRVHIECVGIPPYPTRRYPRVVGLATLRRKPARITSGITYLKGDAADPRGNGHRIIAHVVNDRASTWGGGFARVVRKRWPEVQADFQEWVKTDRDNLSLARSHLIDVNRDLSIFHMICQHGYGPSPKPRIRYQALATCLDELAEICSEKGSAVHMPRIGCGQAGGDWRIVSELIDELLCKRDIRVTVYDLPGTSGPSQQDQGLLFG